MYPTFDYRSAHQRTPTTDKRPVVKAATRPFGPPASAFVGPLPLRTEADLTAAAYDAGRMLFEGAGAAARRVPTLPVFRPTFDRQIPHRLAQDVLRSRLFPLLEEIAQQKVNGRKDRAAGLPSQFDALLEHARALSEDTTDPDKIFDGICSLTRQLDRVLDDVDYVSFGQVGLIGQLRALSVTMRTSRALWASVRTGFAFRDPSLRRLGLMVLARSEATLAKAGHGADVRQDLDRLEVDYQKLVDRLERETGGELALPPTSGFTTARRVLRYRHRAEAEILERQGREGPLTNAELFADIRANGLPPKFLREEIETYVLPALRRVVDKTASERGELPHRIRLRAETLEASLRALVTGPKSDIDEVERHVVEAQEELSKLLEDVEKLIRPADGMVRRLRVANEALLGLRGLFVTLRLTQALEDPSLADGVRNIATDAEHILSGEVSLDEMPAALAALEARLDQLGGELEARLHIENTPAIAQLRGALDAVGRVVRLRLAADAALNPAMRRAVEAGQMPSLSAAERGPIYDAAMKQPLLDTAVGLTVALRELDVGFTFGELGKNLERMLRGSNEGADFGALVARSPLAFLAQAEFEKAFSRFDTFIDRIDTPEGQNFVDRALDILRAVYEVERDSVAHFAAVVPEEDKVRVATGITEYLVRASMILLEWTSAQLADPTGEAVADFLDLMVDTSAADIDRVRDGLDPQAFGKKDVEGARDRVTGEARQQARRAGFQQIGSLGTRLSDGPGGPYAERLRAERAKLEDTLAVVHTTPEARAALRDVLGDLNAAVKMSVNLVQVFGAASNELMDADERQHVIKTSVERMGPMFIKAMQSLVNMESLFKKMSPEVFGAEQDPVIESLKLLQDDVTPLPWSQIEDRIRSSLQLPDGAPLEDRDGVRGHFVSIEKKALKSGSIGQIHRARIRTDDGITEVVVKVLRPGVEEQFENTVRATRLTLSVIQELLRLDKNGEIFGDIKADAEARLPLIERGLFGFIESFRIETDFSREVENLRAFERMYRADPNIVVPEVYDSHTNDGVLTMQELKGFKLSSWTERYAFAQKQPRPAEALGRVPKGEAMARAKQWARETLGLTNVDSTELTNRRSFAEYRITGRDSQGASIRERVRVRKKSGRISVAGDSGGPPRHAAETKARRFAERAFGLPTTGAQSFAVDGGFRVRVTFQDDRQKSAELFVESPSGAVRATSALPDLTARGAENLRDRLRTTLMVQLIQGMLHGDPHEGNFFVMPDGKTIGLIDFGLALDVGLLDARGPLALVAGAFVDDPDKMAEALLDLSTARDLTGAERQQALAPLVAFFEDLTKSAAPPAPKKRRGPLGALKDRFGRAMKTAARSIEAVKSIGVVPLPSVLHALKALFSMVGNIEKLEDFDERKPSKLRTLGLMSKAWLTSALAPFARQSRTAAKHERLEQFPPFEVPEFLRARAPPDEDRGRDESRAV